ncbi:LAGLIDADG family homing endonuclease [Nocardia sp. NPDC051981]|uniref:LAGLIDADG family homing endonuclease n=1 Tax=Nocardia sp. NPDC051981 TaxID=3155417 RepID=UPI003442072A
MSIFLRHLWSTDGSIRWDDRFHQARIYYASTSLRLIHDVANLLLRLEVHGRIKRARKPGYRDCWHLTIDGGDNQITFLQDIGSHGARGVAGEACLVKLDAMTSTPNVDTIPEEIWDTVRVLLATRGMIDSSFNPGWEPNPVAQICGSTRPAVASGSSRRHPGCSAVGSACFARLPVSGRGTGVTVDQ